MRYLLWAVGIASVVAFVSTLSDAAETYEGSSIEIGFSQDGEPEPHLLAVVQDGQVKLYELAEKPKEEDQARAKAPSQPPPGAVAKDMPAEAYLKRMRQALETGRFFTASQPKPKARCKDKYVLRIKEGNKFRERRGCSNQSNDPFAALAQNIFREGFISWRSQGAK